MIREFEVVVAGGGIAGLSAALSSARLGSTTLVLTGGVPGGLLLSIDRIDGFPGFPEGIPGYELCPLAEEQAAGSGAELSPGELERLEARGDGWLLGTNEGDVGARTVILATGASLRELGIPGEERLRGHGVSHCASCDGPLLRDGVVAVVGGGDSALQEALTLAELTASVIVLAREESLSAQETYRQAVLHHPRIEVRHGVPAHERDPQREVGRQLVDAAAHHVPLVDDGRDDAGRRHRRAGDDPGEARDAAAGSPSPCRCR